MAGCVYGFYDNCFGGPCFSDNKNGLHVLTAIIYFESVLK